MSKLAEVGERDGWRCWLCDEPVDAQMSVNDPRGPSVDSLTSKSRKDAGERLAHRGCNTKKGAVKPVLPWPERLFVSDPAPLIPVSERLQRKKLKRVSIDRGTRQARSELADREVVARCPSREDAQQTADWLVDRFSRLVPELPVVASIEAGGGQFLVALTVR